MDYESAAKYQNGASQSSWPGSVIIAGFEVVPVPVTSSLVNRDALPIGVPISGFQPCPSSGFSV